MAHIREEVSTHKTFGEFVRNTTRNRTGVELSNDARWLLWVSAGMLFAPMGLRVARPVFENGRLWFGNEIAAWMTAVTTGGLLLMLCTLLATLTIVVLLASRDGTTPAPLVTACTVGVGVGSLVAVPSLIVIGIVVANLIAFIVVAIAGAVAVFMLCAALIDAANS